MNPEVFTAAAVCMLLTGGCSAPLPKVADRTVTEVDTIISGDLSGLGRASSAAVSASGQLYVADYSRSVILSIEPSTQSVLVIGRPGAGPGEFNQPWGIHESRDTLRVFDQGNGRIQVHAHDTVFIRTYPFTSAAIPEGVSFAPNGQTVVPTLGLSDTALARVYEADGTRGQNLGRIVGEPGEDLDFGALKTEARRGNIPTPLLNTVLSRAESTHVWLVGNADGRVQRFNWEGRKLGEFTIHVSDIEERIENFLRRNREDQRPFVFFPLRLFRDVAVGDNALWILVNTLSDSTAVVLVADTLGLRQRLVLPGIESASRLAIDERLHLAYIVAADGTILRFGLCPGIASSC